MPFEAPVTTATLPFKSVIELSPLASSITGQVLSPEALTVARCSDRSIRENHESGGRPDPNGTERQPRLPAGHNVMAALGTLAPWPPVDRHVRSRGQFCRAGSRLRRGRTLIPLLRPQLVSR